MPLYLADDLLRGARQANVLDGVMPLITDLKGQTQQAVQQASLALPDLDTLLGRPKQPTAGFGAPAQPQQQQQQTDVPGFSLPTLDSILGSFKPQPQAQTQPQTGQMSVPSTDGLAPTAARAGSDPQMPAGTGVAPERAGEYRAYARQVAAQYGIDPDIFERQINQESGFNPSARSPVGAAGIAQFMPGTAAGYGVDVNDPYSSLDGAARHMRDLLRANGGNYRLALAAYNAGQGNVDKWGEGVFDDDFANGQTRDYVNIILGPGSARPEPRQSSMNVAPPSGVAPAAGGEPPARPAAGLPPSVAQKWRQQFGRDPSPEEVQELMGVLA